MKSGLTIGFLLIGLSPTFAQTYKPPQVPSAGDAYVPYQVVVDGFFVLDVSLDGDGTIQKIDSLRDPGAMIGAAKTSVRSWKFRPASKDGKVTPSRMTVSFLYRPRITLTWGFRRAFLQSCPSQTPRMATCPLAFCRLRTRNIRSIASLGAPWWFRLQWMARAT
jgi:hypothetical protein